jgi:hypothetical protein
LSNESYNRNKTIADAKRADEQEGRGYVTGQQTYQGDQYNRGADRRVQATGQAMQSGNQAAGDLAQYRAAQKASGNFFTRNIQPLVKPKELPLPGFAQGAIVTKPTVAMVGEAGPEAVVPLTSDYTPYTPGPHEAGMIEKVRRKVQPSYMSMPHNGYSETPLRAAA